MRSAVELAIGFRDDKYVRKLDSLMLVADKDQILIVSGSGDVIEPENGVCAIGSGGNYALSAGLALLNNTEPNINYELLREKGIYLFGELLTF
jgi:ATP-dependent HslUV protease subunit HslV